MEPEILLRLRGILVRTTTPSPAGSARRGRWAARPHHVRACDAERRLRLWPVGDGEPRALAGVEPGERAITWSADGDSLYVRVPRDLPARVYRVNVTTGERVPWRELMPADPSGVIWIDDVEITPDGAAYAYGCSRILSSDLYVVGGLR